MKHSNSSLAAWAVAALTGLGAAAQAQQPILFQPWAAAVKISKGAVQVTRADRSFAGRVGAKLKVNDVVNTGEDGVLGLIFLDNSVLSMGPGTEVVLKRYNYDPTTYLGAMDVVVNKGTVALQAGDLADSGPNNVNVSTPQAELKGNAKQLLISVEETK